MFHPDNSGSSGPLWLGDWKYQIGTFKQRNGLFCLGMVSIIKDMLINNIIEVHFRLLSLM
jgi:hypothetical protein